MPLTTFLHDSELNRPSGDTEIDELLAEAKVKTGCNYQVVAHRVLGCFGPFGLRRRIEERVQLYVFVGGMAPWQVLQCAHDVATIRAYLLGVVNAAPPATLAAPAKEGEVPAVAVNTGYAPAMAFNCARAVPGQPGTRCGHWCGDSTKCISTATTPAAPKGGEAADSEVQRWKDRYFDRRSVIGQWHAKAVELGYDGVADLLWAVERGEPPLHIAEVLARADAASQPATPAGGGGEVNDYAKGCARAWEEVLLVLDEISPGWDTPDGTSSAIRACSLIRRLASTGSAPAPSGVPDAMKAVQACRDAELFEDGLSGDLASAGITTIADAYMEGRQNACDEIAESLAAAPTQEPRG